MTAKRHILRFLAVMAMIATVTFAWSDKNDIAMAANGANLASFDAIATAGIPPCASGIGTGLAYDTTTDSLVLSCWFSNVLERVDAVTHLNDGPLTIAGASDIGAMAYDAGRNRVWACQGFNTVILIDLTTASVDLSHTPFTVSQCVDGLAYDGSDDTLWISPDVSSTVYHYALDGTLLGSFPVALGGFGNSGIAVGGPKLYLGNNGGAQIYEANKDGSGTVLFATLAARVEDLECDNETFSSSSLGAIWSQDAYDRELNAWEIPADQCASGGGGGGDPVEVSKHWSHTNVCFERDNDGDGVASEDPVNYDAAGAPIDDDGDGLYNEDGSECPDGTSLGTPLPLDEEGDTYELLAVLNKNDKILNYNPGQAYAVSTVEVLSDVEGLVITENYINCTTETSLLKLNPAAGGGGGSVVVVILDENGVPVQVLDATDPAIAVTDSEAVVTLGPQEAGTTIMVYVKFGPGLKGQTFVGEEYECSNVNSAQALDEAGALIGDPVSATADLELVKK